MVKRGGQQREVKHVSQLSQGFAFAANIDAFALALAHTSPGYVWNGQGSRSERDVARLAFKVFEVDAVEPPAANCVERNGFSTGPAKLPKMSLSGTAGAHDSPSSPLNEGVGAARVAGDRAENIASEGVRDV